MGMGNAKHCTLERSSSGRMSRILFIENTHSKEYFPLSIMLRRLHKPEIMEHIFKIVSFPGIVNNSDRVVHYHDSADYYVLNIDDKLLRLITKCICICREMMYLYVVFEHNGNKYAIITKLIRANINENRLDKIFGEDSDGINLFFSSDFNDKRSLTHALRAMRITTRLLN